MLLIRTNSDNIDFKNLVKELDSYLKTTDGEEHAYYNQFNSIESLKNVVVAYIDGQAVGCGAFKKFDSNSVEIKRMFTLPQERGNGVASKILKELENWSLELNNNSCILETGKRQIEAASFYQKNGYSLIPNYGQYINMDNSLCFRKTLS